MENDYDWIKRVQKELLARMAFAGDYEWSLQSKVMRSLDEYKEAIEDSRTGASIKKTKETYR